MKTKKYFFSLAIILLFAVNSFAQTSDPQLEYTYDANGNRHMRHVIYINYNKSLEANDSTNNGPNDSSAIAANINNAFNDSQSSNESTNSNSGVTGMEQYTENIGDQQIIVYPNPTKGYLHIKIAPFNTDIPTEITVYDLQGRLMLEKSCTSELTIVDFSKYTTASYILKVRIRDKQSEWKIVKQ